MIEIKDLSFGYTRKDLFSHLDLKLEPGNIYGLLGKNGAGKTTLLKLIAGLRYAQSGSVRVLGCDPGARPAHMLDEILSVSEELFIPPLLPRTYVSLYAPFYPRFDHGEFTLYMTEFELEKDKKLSALSYGQKKKFVLAFGLASGCKVLLLDEPTNGLDIPSKGQFRKLLTRAASDDRIILVSTHQVRDMENLIDPLIVLDQGRIIFQQPMSEVTRRLSARLQASEPADDGILYADRTLGGWVVVRENTGDEETRLDLETLFNTVTGNPERVAEIFRAAASMEARNA
ncbi:MAG TPA: ABC transporter ATP-binding protein [Spirochaetia bacterium]|nr:ABC transporter ATP-binding protein [Spirochaetia bacterium]